MTREEAIGKWIYPAIATMWPEDKCNEILEALEQESILDKIRAEIADQRDFMLDCDGESDLGIALDIIDKYMESEDKE